MKFNKENTKLVGSNPSANIKLTKIPDEVEKCKIIDNTNECNNISDSQCGYCWDSDKILYGDSSGPKTDVCTKKGWVAPGPNTAFFCQKKILFSFLFASRIFISVQLAGKRMQRRTW